MASLNGRLSTDELTLQGCHKTSGVGGLSTLRESVYEIISLNTKANTPRPMLSNYNHIHLIERNLFTHFNP